MVVGLVTSLVSFGGPGGEAYNEPTWLGARLNVFSLRSNAVAPRSIAHTHRWRAFLSRPEGVEESSALPWGATYAAKLYPSHGFNRFGLEFASHTNTTDRLCTELDKTTCLEEPVIRLVISFPVSKSFHWRVCM